MLVDVVVSVVVFYLVKISLLVIKTLAVSSMMLTALMF